MIIVDDRVIFEASDIRRFSEGVQRAIAAATPPHNSPADFLSTVVNEAIFAAKEKLIAGVRVELRPIAEVLALRQASPENLNLARDRINDARIALGLPLL